MKRKQPPAWTKKLDKECLQFLAGVRYAKWADKEIKDRKEARKFVTDVLPKLFPGFAQGRKMVITSELLQILEAAGMPIRLAVPIAERAAPGRLDHARRG